MTLPNINAAVLFVKDVDTCVAFYRDVVGLEPTFSDDVSSAFRLGSQDFVVLALPAAVKMLTEVTIAPQSEGVRRTLLCVGVEDVDATYKELTAKGLTFIKPPVSQVWGRRTAYFADPEGNLWELYHMLPNG